MIFFNKVNRYTLIIYTSTLMKKCGLNKKKKKNRETRKENIYLNEPFNEQRFHKWVLH